jgi:EF hand
MEANSGLRALTLLSGIGLALAALPASAQQMTCDTNSDGMVHATEAATCAAQRFDEAAGGRREMTQEQFGTAYPDAEGGGADLFDQADADASGAISREEWMTWRRGSARPPRIPAAVCHRPTTRPSIEEARSPPPSEAQALRDRRSLLRP